MKKQLFKLFVATLVIGIFTVSSAFAQQTLNIEVPFDFQIGQTKLESGSYQIQKIDSVKSMLRNVETNRSTLFIAEAQIGDESLINSEKLVFNRYGDTYFLREIYAKRGMVGRELPLSSAERKIRKEYKNNPQLAENKSNPEQVSINSDQ